MPMAGWFCCFIFRIEILHVPTLDDPAYYVVRNEDSGEETPVRSVLNDLSAGIKCFPSHLKSGEILNIQGGSIVEIYSVSGQPMWRSDEEEEQARVKLDGFDPGLYIVAVSRVNGDRELFKIWIVD